MQGNTNAAGLTKSDILDQENNFTRTQTICSDPSIINPNQTASTDINRLTLDSDFLRLRHHWTGGYYDILDINNTESRINTTYFNKATGRIYSKANSAPGYFEILPTGITLTTSDNPQDTALFKVDANGILWNGVSLIDPNTNRIPESAIDADLVRSSTLENYVSRIASYQDGEGKTIQVLNTGLDLIGTEAYSTGVFINWMHMGDDDLEETWCVPEVRLRDRNTNAITIGGEEYNDLINSLDLSQAGGIVFNSYITSETEGEVKIYTNNSSSYTDNYIRISSEDKDEVENPNYPEHGDVSIRNKTIRIDQSLIAHNSSETTKTWNDENQEYDEETTTHYENIQFENGNISLSASGNVLVPTPDGNEAMAACNVGYVDAIVGSIETLLATI